MSALAAVPEPRQAEAAGQPRAQAAAAEKSEELRRPRWTLGNLAEHRVRCAGLRRLHEELVMGRPQEPPLRLTEMPRRKDGSPLVMQASFFERLLSDRLELKGCLESDISAAHLDLRHLSAEQLLVIRVRNLDFQTLSESHSTHTNFLESLDACLSEKVARKILCSRARPGAPPQAKPAALRALGRRTVLTLGATELLAGGWGVPSAGNVAEVPTQWAIELEAGGWPGRSAALLDVQQLRLQIPAGEQCPELSWAAVRGQVAVACDSSSGTRHSRRFQWEITLVDPRKTNIPAMLSSSESTLQQRLLKDVTSALSQRSGLGSLPRPLRAGWRSPGRAAAAGPEAAEASAGQRGRCPRASVAFLDGRVAGAIARMESTEPTAAP